MEHSVVAGQRVLIFSYNRGRFLKNAVNSIIRHFPTSKITIIDDHSDDFQTAEILNLLSSDFEILMPPKPSDLDERTGGLHHAMNYAFEVCENRGEPIVLVMQDDMQFVRDMSQEEVSRLSSFFDDPTLSFVIGCNFCKTYRGTRNARMHRVGDLYFRTQSDTGIKSSYSDTGLFYIPRLRQTLGHLTKGEASNEERAARAGLRIGITTMPFMNFLPFPVSYRGRRRDWRAMALDFVSGASIHELQPLAGDKLDAFLQRNPDCIPFDEDWLTAPSAPRCKYWSYHGGKSNARARGGWRKLLSKMI